jgi:hypothetical protein
MVQRKPALDAGAACADGFLADIEVDLDALGPAVIVQGERHPTNAARLRYLGRRALAIASALEGVPNEDPPITGVEPFARIWPPRLPVEAGIPDDLMGATDLTPLDRLAWIEMYRLSPHLTGRPPSWQGRLSWLAKRLDVSPEALGRSLERLDASGWATSLKRAPPPSGYGERKVDLHLQRRVDAPAAGAIDTTASPKDGSR